MFFFIQLICCSFNYNILAIKKLKSGDLTKIIEGHKFVIIDYDKFIGIYYDKFESVNYFN